MMISTLEAASLKNPRTYSADAGLPQPNYAEVVEAIFGPTDPRSIHVTEFKGDPGNKDDTRWNGQRLSGRTLPDGRTRAPSGNANSYLCLGVLDPNTSERKLVNVIGHVAFWMDDVGDAPQSKTPLQKVHDWIARFGIHPTLVVQTSPGNFSYLWAIERVDADGSFEDQTVAAVRATMKAKGFGDPVTVTDAARYMRSGFGINGKAAYRGADGSPWPVKITAFNPAARVHVNTFAAAMIGADWRDEVAAGAYLSSAQIVAQGGPSERHASMDDPLVKLAALVGLDPQPSTRHGVISAHCPNEAAHTNGDPTGYDFINRGMSYCNHASCAHLKSPDFQAMIEDRYDKMIADGLADGSICESPFPGEDGVLMDATTGEKLAPDARTFLAGASFEGVGIDADQQAALAALVPATEPGVPEWVARLNEKFAYVLALDRVVEISRDDSNIVARHTTTAFKAYFGGEEQLLSGKGRVQGLGTAWLKSPYARRYERVGLWPVGMEPDGSLNMWQGLPAGSAWLKAAGPATASRPLDTVLAFVRNVIASNRAPVADHVLNWLAWKVQNPLTSPGTALALIGRQGTGKTTLTEMAIDIFGERYAVTASQERHMTGNFNAHFSGKVLAVFEEAFLGKDPRMAGAFKDLVTGARLHIEEKRVDTRDEPNRLAIMLTSNDASVVPLEPGDRRTTLIEVSDAHRADNAYFGELRAAWTHGGREAFIEFLQARDLSAFDPRIPLNTDEKARAMGEAGDLPTRFWAEMLDKGVLPVAPGAGSHNITPDWSASPVFVSDADMYDAFEQFARRVGQARYLPSGTKLRERLGQLCPNRVAKRPRLGHKSGPRGYEYPPLGQCEAAFAAAAGVP